MNCPDCDKDWRNCNCENEEMKAYAQAMSDCILGCGIPYPEAKDYFKTTQIPKKGIKQ